MKILLQRVKKASCKVNNEIIGKINNGLLLFVGFTEGDNESVIEQMAKKCIELRIFSDENGKMNKSLLDVNGSVLSISQFTLYANCLKGRRPSFENSENPLLAKKHYEYFNTYISNIYNIEVQVGEFGADMEIELINDGPVTIMLDSNEIVKK